MPAPKKAKKAKEYTARLNINGKVYEAEGASPTEALGAFKVTGTIPRTKGILIMEREGVIRTRILAPFVVQRMFSPSPLAKEIALKNLSLLFEGL